MHRVSPAEPHRVRFPLTTVTSARKRLFSLRISGTVIRSWPGWQASGRSPHRCHAGDPTNGWRMLPERVGRHPSENHSRYRADE